MADQRRISNLFVFVVVLAGREHVMALIDETGKNVPLVFSSKDLFEERGVREKVQEIVDKHNVFAELREYVLRDNVESYYPKVLAEA